MAREVIFKTWCDPCLGQDERQVEGMELPPLLLPELPGTKPVTVALCEVHRKELYEPLVEVLRAHGQHIDDDGNPTGPRGRYKKAEKDKPAREQNVPGGVDCPRCGHNSPNRSAMSSHVRNMHHTTLADLEGAPLPYECPECKNGFSAPQGLAAHRRIAHGVPGQGKKGTTAAPGADQELPVPEASTG